MTAFADDWSGGLARTLHLPNNAVAVEVLGAGEAIRVRLRDGTACVLSAAEVSTLAAGETAQHAIRESIYRACLARQRASGAA